MTGTTTDRAGSGNSKVATTVLAGVSVAMSLTSLVLSYRTWRRIRHPQQDDSRCSSQYKEISSSKSQVQPIKTKEESYYPTIRMDENRGNSLSLANNQPSKNEDNGNQNNNTNSDQNRNFQVRPTLENQILSNNDNNGLLVRPIGTVRSIYRLCVGTPRQGLLAPHARGRIELSLPDHQSAKDAVIGLEHYSHIWIVFVFHLNTLPKNQKISSKIAPPSLGGTKVGVLATRSPHRFNPIGITLAILDRIEIIKTKNTNRKETDSYSRSKSTAPPATVALHISGLDLVEGTPVLDIKPFVPHYDTAESQYHSHNTLLQGGHNIQTKPVRLPPWVSGGLGTKRNVRISEKAQEDLLSILSKTPKNKMPPLEFYGHNETIEETMENVLECIKEVLSIDVRSSWQTKKARQGKYQAERAQRLRGQEKPRSLSFSFFDATGSISSKDYGPAEQHPKEVSTLPADNTLTCTQQLDNLLIHYTVSETSQLERPTSEGSGAEDQVYVTSIVPMQW